MLFTLMHCSADLTATKSFFNVTVDYGVGLNEGIGGFVNCLVNID